MIFGNLIKAIEEELKDKMDPRDMSIVLRSEPSPRMHLPPPCVPCLMIGAGSGLAPFRSFWQDLLMATNRPVNGHKHLLIIQMRTRESMPFEDEIFSMVKHGMMDVEIMFSRDECVAEFSENEIVYRSSPGRKGYIDKIIESPKVQERLADMICNQAAHIYVCGHGGLARTVVGSLHRTFCNLFGERQGRDELEKMMAENRMVLETFTSLKEPSLLKKELTLSELCMCNDFCGDNILGENTSLYLAINSSIYDVKEFLLFHPGGSTILKFYCGMDATHAWNAVKHNRDAAVVAMLEIYDTNMNLKHPTNLNLDDKNWYFSGWKEMTMTLVEIQNAMNVAFDQNWYGGEFSSTEKDLGQHFTVWKGTALWRPKRSILKGQFLCDTHKRLWSIFLPTLLGDPFDELRFESLKGNIDEETERFMTEMKESRSHFVCDSVYILLKEALDEASKIGDKKVIPSKLQSYMEEMCEVDKLLLEELKARLVTGLQVFENNKSPLLPTFDQTFTDCILGLLLDLKNYMEKVASLTVTAFGFEKVHEIVKSPNLERGGLTLLYSEKLDSVNRQYVDKEEAQTKVLGASVNVDKKLCTFAANHMGAGVQ